MAVRIAALMAVAALALAGCSSDSEEPADVQVGDPTAPTESAPPAGPGATAPRPTDGNEPEANVAPVPLLTASATEGEPPIDVVFEFDAADENDDPLTWTLDVNGDGEADAEGNENNLPGTFTFSYTESGAYTATFTVSDGTEPASAEVSLAFELSGPTQQDPVVIDGTFTAAVYEADHATNTHTVELTSKPSSIYFDLEQDSGCLDLDWTVFAPDGTSAGRKANFEMLDDFNEDDIEVTDAALLSQMGPWTVEMQGYLAAACAYSVTVTFNY